MSTFVMSDKYPCFVNEIKKYGHSVISSDRIQIFPKPEQNHADMQLLQINDRFFILNECKSLSKKLPPEKLMFCSKKAGGEYPENILLNFLFLNNILYGKISAIDNNMLSYCNSKKIKTVNINQGYARCSALIVNNNAVVTSDISIAKTLKANGVEVLLISAGHIILDGYDYGFIGGASGRINENTIVFFGNVKNHPDYDKIENFCKKHSMNINILCKDIPLTDIGGMVQIK